MKILLDECVTKRLKAHLSKHEVFTVTEQGWNGYRNGQLMTAASNKGFDVLLTIDKNLQHQQNIGKYPLIIIVLDAPSSKLEVLVTFLAAFEQLLPTCIKGNAYIVEL